MLSGWMLMIGPKSWILYLPNAARRENEPSPAACQYLWALILSGPQLRSSKCSDCPILLHEPIS
jgi:hypothetical protein